MNIAVALYELDHGVYPGLDVDIIAPTSGPINGRSYISNTNDITDGRGQRIRYARVENGYEIRSTGPDMLFGTEDDIVWDKHSPNKGLVRTGDPRTARQSAQP